MEATPGEDPAQALAAAAAGVTANGALAVAPTAASPVAPRKQRHSVRPPVRHRWARPLEEPGGAVLPGLPPLPPQGLVTPTIFQHELLQNFALTVFCKVGRATTGAPLWLTAAAQSSSLKWRVLLSCLGSPVHSILSETVCCAGAGVGVCLCGDVEGRVCEACPCCSLRCSCAGCCGDGQNTVKPVRRYRELREALMGRIAAYALQFRINKRYKVCPKSARGSLLPARARRASPLLSAVLHGPGRVVLPSV